MGAGGKEVWTFKAMGIGTEYIVLEYVRDWEGGLQGDTLVFEIIVVD